jgi:hypothetical protein
MVARPRALGLAWLLNSKRLGLAWLPDSGTNLVFFWAWPNVGHPGKLKKNEVLIFHMKKLRNNPCGYKLKDYFKRFFIPH